MEEKELPIVETKPLTYLCKFDENGRRGETRLACEYTEEQKEEMIADGFVEISENDWNYYVGNRGAGDNGTGYIRDTKTGRPVSAPAHIPTKAELLAQLESQYKADKSELTAYFAEAMLSGNEDVIAELKEEMSELEADYEAERQEILEG